MPELHLYDFIHGPEVWLAVCGLCGLGIVAILGVCVANSGQLRDIEDKMRRDDDEN